MERKEFLTEIESNIEVFGHHISIVTGGSEPRYAYTIGLTKIHNIELILAGCAYYLKDDIYAIINRIIEQINSSEDLENMFSINSLGNFKLQKVHSSWSKITLLGAIDYFNLNTLNAYQILPDENHYTLDIPDMSKEWNSDLESAWKWLKDDWKYEIPSNITVVTNLDALKGQPITEVMRWESEEWEMFAGAGPDVEQGQIRVVPIGLLFSIDNTLQTALNLDIGKGMWRKDKGSEWNDWQ